MSTPSHITITRGRNGPSTRVPRVMRITSFGSHSSRMFAAFAVLGLCYSLSSPRFCSWMCEFRVYCWVVQGCSFCGASLNFPPHSRWFCKPLHDSQQLVRCLRVGKSLVRAARRTGRRRVKWPRRRPRHPRMRVRRLMFRWRMILSWWMCWLAKLSCGSLRLVGRTPTQQREDPLPALWGGGQSEAEVNKTMVGWAW